MTHTSIRKNNISGVVRNALIDEKNRRSLSTEPLDEWNQWRYALFLRLFSLNRRQPSSPKNLVSLPKAVDAAMDSLTPQTVSPVREANAEL
ncbi:hypothetical protein [Microseira wollei]|uniref:hypothetical protein n=1 Tax=Microseira wollei TaxID=467598 RepID=UPI001CFE136C|nr:hypothetical protein [Microseira wollei]